MSEARLPQDRRQLRHPGKSRMVTEELAGLSQHVPRMGPEPSAKAL